MLHLLPLLAGSLLSTAVIGAETNLVKNPEFTLRNKDGKPAGWNDAQKRQSVSVDVSEKPPGSAGSLKVKITTEVANRSGEIVQTIPVKPHTRYRMSGWLRGSSKGIGFIQVKRRQGRKELDRIDTARNGTSWGEVDRFFDSGDADNVSVLCRWNQQQKNIGETLWFSGINLSDATGLPEPGAHEPFGVPTFESIGLYWKPAGGGTDNPCRLSFREAGSSEWREGHPLWFDPNNHQGRPENSREYRGSLVHLSPGTNYEIRLRLEKDGTERTLNVKTWDNEFKVRKVIELPAAWAETRVISEGGSEEEGYVVYAPAEGQQSVGDAGNAHDVNIRVDAPYVILRGLTLRNASRNAIELGRVHHVVIENCDISGWGRISSDGFGANADAAVYGNNPVLENIVIQGCQLHHPRSHANSWNEERTLPEGGKTSHPMGAQGLFLRKGKGRYVVRNNRIYSDMDHMFNDGMGEMANFSFAGFPNRDSDIYGNFVSHCRDDGLEIEGANMNVRVWNNCTDATMMSLAAAGTSLGPVYFWRNISLRSRYGPTSDWNGTKGGGFLKLGNESTAFTRGRIYVYHNTIFQPLPWPGSTRSSGCRSGIICTGSTKRQQHILTRNNILHCRREKEPAIRDPFTFATNDFDYDLIHGKVSAREGSEKNGVRAIPKYADQSGGVPGLQPGSPGHDAGVRIPNFNDDFQGKAPDMGAVETGIPFFVPEGWPGFPELTRE